jgi:hypothetical protein
MMSEGQYSRSEVYESGKGFRDLIEPTGERGF